MLDDGDVNLLGSFDGVGGVAGGVPSIDEIMNMQLDEDTSVKTRVEKLARSGKKKKQRASMADALWEDDVDEAHESDEDDDANPATPAAKTPAAAPQEQTPHAVDAQASAEIDAESPAPATVVTAECTEENPSFTSQDRSERYAVICGSCKALNSVPTLGQRFVCRQCNQGSVVSGAADRSISPSESWMVPVSSTALDCEGCPDTGNPMTFHDWRGRILRYYAKHAPERVPGRQLDQMLRTWAGREQELWRRMVDRYGPEPSEEEGSRLLADVLAAQAPDESIDFSGKAEVIEVAAKSKRKVPPPPSATLTIDTEAHNGVLGVGVRDVHEPERNAWDGGVRGVVIENISPGSASDASQLVPYHLITAADGSPIASSADLLAVLKTSEPGAMEVVVMLFTPALRCHACKSSKVRADTAFAYTCQLCGLQYTAAEDKTFKAAAVDSKADPETGATLTVQEWRLRMLHFYAKHAPDRVHGRQVDQILRSWAGREDELWKNMVARYGEPPTEEEGHALLADVLAQAAPPEEPVEAAKPTPEPKAPVRMKNAVGAKMTSVKQILALKAKQARERRKSSKHKDPAPAGWGAPEEPQPQGPQVTYDE